MGGTIHLVVNNQVAFTTDPKFSRSSVYCTDVAKGLGIPVFHVNGDDVEAVVHACELAVEWRQKWKSDVVVDIVCYRRYGHNEIDDPMFTQPLMYKVIKQHRSAYQQYADRLVREGTVSPQEVAEIHDRVIGILNSEFDASKSFETQKKDWLASMWKGARSLFYSDPPAHLLGSDPPRGIHPPVACAGSRLFGVLLFSLDQGSSRPTSCRGSSTRACRRTSSARLAWRSRSFRRTSLRTAPSPASIKPGGTR